MSSDLSILLLFLAINYCESLKRIDLNYVRKHNADDMRYIVPTTNRTPYEFASPIVKKDVPRSYTGQNILKYLSDNKHNNISKVQNVNIEKPVDIESISITNENTKSKINKSRCAPLVSTSEGVLKGTVAFQKDLTIYQFRGIPYASMPERFKAPKAPKPWNGIRNAVNEAEICLQYDISSDRVLGNEDCLYLNVHTPTLDDDKLPVIVFIHGGKFKAGSPRLFGPDKLIQHRVVFVSVAYRLGVLGFLSTGTKHAPGNAALKDIVEALHWTHRNIHMFGGDTYNICIYGISSGAMMAEYLTLSPMAKGLFSKVILHSGSALTSWAYARDPLRFAFKLGRYTGNNAINIDDLMKHLQQIDNVTLIRAERELSHEENPLEDFTIPFIPITEKSIAGEEIFLPDSPENILKKGIYNDVPMMIGFNDREGLFFLKKVQNLPNYLKSVDEIFEFILPSDLFISAHSYYLKENIIKKVKSFYFQNRTIGMEQISNYINFIGDVSFIYAIQKSVKIRLKTSKNPIYYYEFAYDGKSEHPYGVNSFNGVSHGEDIPYIFTMPNNTMQEMGQKDVSKILTTLITNFAKYGNPTPAKMKPLSITWYPIKSEETCDYLRITKSMEMKENPNEIRYKFWQHLYEDTIFNE